MHRKCLGCGCVLQSEDSSKVGYIPEKKYSEAIYCYRCFRLKHYHEYQLADYSKSNDAFLKESLHYQVPIFYFLDFLNVNEEALSWFRAIKKEKVLVFSKTDLIPYDIPLVQLELWIRKTYSIEEPILFLSSKKEKLVSKLMNYIVRKGYSTVLFLGMTNVGKSTCLNALAKQYNGEKTDALESEMPNTTLGFTKWNIGDVTIIDAPGFNYENNPFLEDVCFIRKVNPVNHFKPITMPLKRVTGLMLEDICYLTQNELVNSTTFYGSDKLSLKKVYQVPTYFETMEEVVFNVPAGNDLVLKGIGFFYFKTYTKVTLRIASFNIVSIRPSVFGVYHDSH